MIPEKYWKINDKEWETLQHLLSWPNGDQRRRGRTRLDNKREAAEACLYRHYHSHSEKYRCFDWHQLPVGELGITATTANRRYREWLCDGSWVKFWDALNHHRAGESQPRKPTPKRYDRNLPVSEIIAELERAYEFFNDLFFAGTLDINVAISLEVDNGRSGVHGYFCGRQWRGEHEVLSHIGITTACLGQGALPVMEVLLHEMVHLRNFLAGIPDCHPSNQYHNRHFRDTAKLAGLECLDRDHNRGYADTSLGERAREAITKLHPDDGTFLWRMAAAREREVVIE